MTSDLLSRLLFTFDRVLLLLHFRALITASRNCRLLYVVVLMIPASSRALGASCYIIPIHSYTSVLTSDSDESHGAVYSCRHCHEEFAGSMLLLTNCLCLYRVQTQTRSLQQLSSGKRKTRGRSTGSCAIDY